ncbi:MAG: hydroxyisourate hydrolase [Tabrizicola sp.]|nr:hydroxyisourate hydrolase [Tabrizicola sp.]
MGSGRLTTHVLDTARGQPAAGVGIALFRLAAGRRDRIADARTNADGRTDQPLLQGAGLVIGQYELVFHAGEYLRGSGLVAGDVLFLDEIPIRFGLSNADQHYHVPLLISPFGYSTYRGS